MTFSLPAKLLVGILVLKETAADKDNKRALAIIAMPIVGTRNAEKHRDTGHVKTSAKHRRPTTEREVERRALSSAADLRQARGVSRKGNALQFAKFREALKCGNHNYDSALCAICRFTETQKQYSIIGRRVAGDEKGRAASAQELEILTG